MDKLIEHKDIDLVKIVTGIRRCGKSSLLELFHQHLLDSKVEKERIIHMNLESLKYRELTDYLTFYNYVSALIKDNQRHYLIFDELQAIRGFEKAIESFRLDFDVDIYITGSNAHLLSTEFSTLLSGRYVEIKMLPLSFVEFLDFYEFEEKVTLEERFEKYLQFGGMPILRQYNLGESGSLEALEGIYSTVILRDVLERGGGINQLVLEKIVRFLCSNIGNFSSPNNIGNVLYGSGSLDEKQKLAGRTISKYMGLLEKAFIFHAVNRYDIKGKQLLKTLSKHYITDLGFRNMLLGYRNTDRGHILENVVFLELLRRGYRVYVGKVGATEVDFIAERPNEKLYIQVTESMQNEEVRKRELRSLEEIKDNYEKIVLSMDRSFNISYNGIKSLNVVDWLMKR
jgi:predicted AAA+ superfamily ATPase